MIYRKIHSHPLRASDKFDIKTHVSRSYWSMADKLNMLWRSVRTVMEMLTDRGYDLPDQWEYDEKCTVDVFREVHGDEDPDAIKKTMTFLFKKEDKNMIMTFWKGSLGTSDIQEIHEKMIAANVTRAIVVYTTKITPYAAGALRHLKVQKVNIETFSEVEMQYNVTRHVDVPRHIICSATKKARVLEDYSVTQDQLPQIKSTEAQCRYYGATKGQLMKIVRPSDSVPEVAMSGKPPKELYDITYRIVV